MLKRAFWFTTGTAVGLGSSLYVQRRVKQVAQRYVPEQVSRDVADRVRRLGRDVREAASEGRQAMRVREAELRDDVLTRRRGQPPTGSPAAGQRPRVSGGGPSAPCRR